MLDLRWLLDNEETARKKLRLRAFPEGVVDEIRAADTSRRALLKEVEELRSRRNAIAKEIGMKKRGGEPVDALMDESNRVNERIGAIDGSVTETVRRVECLLLGIPNMVDDSVPPGEGAADNKELRRWGNPPQFPFRPLDHHDLGLRLGILDFERATRMAGARFSVLMGRGARLERALINFMLDLHSQEHGYAEMITPFLCNSAAMTGTSQLPKFREDLFKLEGLDYYLIPTAEVPV
ncbi:MAG: serine--tRNA ligase, partial [Bdellovibrionales bacterium]|nr:serine--tRNA ligase [Bdellovibrionales bacterium]